jgi:hypothetical protein
MDSGIRGRGPGAVHFFPRIGGFFVGRGPANAIA